MDTINFPSLLQLCVQKLALNLIKYGPKKVRFGRLKELPRAALEALLTILVSKNALNDNVLPHALTRQTQKLGLEGCSQLRRCVLQTIGRSCPNLRVLDLRSCQQVENRIVRDVLQYCERLESLRLDGCTRISDSAFAPALWKPPLAGLLGLRELSVGKCNQITAEGLLGYVMKGAPYLRSLGLAFCKLSITDDVASELLYSFGMESLDLSFCAQITNAPFQGWTSSQLRELRMTGTPITDATVEGIAQRAPELEVFEAGYALKFSDCGLASLVDSCSRLRTLCVPHTQLTDASFVAILRCQHLERLDASWCLRATPQALNILAAPSELGRRPPLRELVLDHIGALELCVDRLGPLPPPASPGLWAVSAMKGSGFSPMSSPAMPGLSSRWSASRYPPEPPSLYLPPPANPLPPSAPTLVGDESPPAHTTEVSPPASPRLSGASVAFAAAQLNTAVQSHLQQQPLPPSLKSFVEIYGASIEQLILDGIQNIGDPMTLEAIAMCCPQLQQIALTFSPGSDNDGTLETALGAMARRCERLTLARFDCTSRSHPAVVASLALPSFEHLRSLTLACHAKGGGLRDSELEVILRGRTALETLELRNCEGLSEGLFPRWCNRGERHDEAEVVQQLDQALLSSLAFGAADCFGHDLSVLAVAPPASLLPDPLPSNATTQSRPLRRHREPRCPAALALRSITSFSLWGATALSDRSGDALAELLHDAQVVDLRGCPLFSDEVVRSFRKGCRFIRSVSVVTRDRTFSWTASTSTVKKHSHRKPSFHTSGSSGTESN